MTDRFRVVPAAYVVMRRGDEVLLQLRRNTGYMDGFWATAAAGHVEAGESVFEAAVREALEEIGVGIAAADLSPLCAMHRTVRTVRTARPVDERVDFFFECSHWSGEPQLLEADKAAELGWFPLLALPTPVVPHERFVLDRVKTGNLPAVVSFGFG